MTDQKRSWAEPSLMTLDIPEVELLLAESYREQATAWADAAEARRKRAHEAAAASED